MKSKFKVLLGVLAILLIIFMGYMFAKYINIVQTNADNENINQDIRNEIVDQVSNDLENDIKNIVEENEINNELENNIENEVDNKINNEDKEVITNKKDDKQKAIDMAQNKWGVDDSVSFKIDEQIGNGKFVIKVVDKNTTKVIFWYEVDVENNIIEEK